MEYLSLCFYHKAQMLRLGEFVLCKLLLIKFEIQISVPLDAMVGTNFTTRHPVPQNTVYRLQTNYQWPPGPTRADPNPSADKQLHSSQAAGLSHPYTSNIQQCNC